jgi:hypothetical protein
MREQKLRLKLFADRGLLIVRRPSGGDWGKGERWKIAPRSYLPRALYFIIQNFVKQRVKRCDNKGDPDALRKSVLRGLCEAAETCGCDPQLNKEGADVVWYLNDIPLIGFYVANDKCKKREVRWLLDSAVFRWTIRVEKSGWFLIRARETNRGFRREKPVKANWLSRGGLA